ncbi:MAG: PIN domain-containing protein [Synergistaceae bacterium]|jgi:predicted nucleic-acid-binding protein|nr:PIN domain-containing protein [Synergistaceae bacterium]
MRVVVDNNVVVDALKPNPKFAVEAQEILRLASAKAIDGFISANSLTDIFYVLRKEHGAGKAKAMIQKLLLLLDIIGNEPADCVDALERPMNDFEDALIDVCAKKIGADCVVSRDEAFIKAVKEIDVITPNQLLAKIR